MLWLLLIPLAIFLCGCLILAWPFVRMFWEAKRFERQMRARLEQLRPDDAAWLRALVEHSRLGLDDDDDDVA